MKFSDLWNVKNVWRPFIIIEKVCSLNFKQPFCALRIKSLTKNHIGLITVNFISIPQVWYQAFLNLEGKLMTTRVKYKDPSNQISKLNFNQKSRFRKSFCNQLMELIINPVVKLGQKRGFKNNPASRCSRQSNDASRKIQNLNKFLILITWNPVSPGQLVQEPFLLFSFTKN